MPRLCQILQVKVIAGLGGHSKRIRLPITPLILRKMKQVWFDREKDYDKVMMWAATTLPSAGQGKSLFWKGKLMTYSRSYRIGISQ